MASPSPARRRALSTLVLAALALTWSTAADARATTLKVPVAVDRDCTGSAAPGPGIVTKNLRAPSLATVEARLFASDGDWDLAIVDRAAGRVVAGSATRGSQELAAGYARAGQRLAVRACRRSGSDPTARLVVNFTEIVKTHKAQPLQMARVATPDAASQRRLHELGLDLTEHAGDGYVNVVLHGARDAAALRAAGLEWEVLIGDLAAEDAARAAADRRYARGAQSSALPSGRTTYRRLFDYAEEMKALADQNPDLVRPLTLALETYEGRTVEGIEITENADQRRDGKPVFLMMGVHHAREWPSGEHAMEWAYELINGFKAGDERTTRLVRNTRTIIVPIVNPDGFNASREAGELLGFGGGRAGNDILNYALAPNEYRRKNCRLLDDSAAGNCLQPSVGLAEPGVDPNRNYGGFWGGPGASTDPTAQDYRGPGPFSEPETENVRRLISGRQVVTLITNHTFSNLVLRPPGIAIQGDTVDEPLYKAFGDAMAGENGYASQQSFNLYDTTGGTEDWSYYATGGLGFTFEIGCNPDPLGDPTGVFGECAGNFHPPYADVIAEYEGGSPAAQAVGGGGNREAYFIAQESTANRERHSVLTGKAPAGAVLEISKSFQTPTSPQADGEPIMLDDTLRSELKVGDSGEFEWDINPSTRPLVAEDSGRQAQGSPSPPQADSGDSTTTVPPIGCADFDTDDPNCWNDHAFTVPGDPGTDNDAATVSIEWALPVNDWDLKVFRDTDSDGTSQAETEADLVASSGNPPPGTSESATFVSPEAPDGRLQPGDYVARVVNYAAPAPDPYELTVQFEGPGAFSPARIEAWQLTCSVDDKVQVSREVRIARGERRDINLRDACDRAGNSGLRCAGAPATVLGSRKADSLRGTKGADVIVALGGRDRIRGQGGNDRICGGGGKDRLKGGGGRDRLKGHKSKDRLAGGPGNDRLGGGRGADRLKGGGGRDRCKGGPGRDRLRSC
jgi:hypothetical protein